MKNIGGDKSKKGARPFPKDAPRARKVEIPLRPRLRSANQRVRFHGMAGIGAFFRPSSYFSRSTNVKLGLDLRDWQDSGPERPPELRVERPRLEDLREWRSRNGTAGLPEDFLADQIFGLSGFYLGVWEEEIAHILWISRSGEACSVSSLRLEPGDVEFRNVHTLDRFRRRKIFSHVLRAALRDLKAEGVKNGFAHVKEHNVASLNGFREAGFVPLERVVIRRVFGCDRVCLEPIDEKTGA